VALAPGRVIDIVVCITSKSLQHQYKFNTSPCKSKQPYVSRQAFHFPHLMDYISNMDNSIKYWALYYHILEQMQAGLTMAKASTIFAGEQLKAAHFFDTYLKSQTK